VILLGVAVVGSGVLIAVLMSGVTEGSEHFDTVGTLGMTIAVALLACTAGTATCFLVCYFKVQPRVGAMVNWRQLVEDPRHMQ
jgi:hypothetical protein